jgi:hypothetical protein
MPHQVHRCLKCRRPVHWPNPAPIGTERKCRCGEVYVMARNGKIPTHTERSLPPPKQTAGGSFLQTVVGAAVLAALAYFLLFA